MKVKNKTPHEVKIVDEYGDVIKIFPRSTNLIRLESETKRVGELNSIPLSKTEMKGGDMPPEEHGVYYIVSRAVQEAYPERRDLLIPNETVRDDNGKIVGCKSLAVFSSLKFVPQRIKKLICGKCGFEMKNPSQSELEKDWDHYLDYVEESIGTCKKCAKKEVS